METFERDLRNLTKNLHQYSLIEFYHEEMDIKRKIYRMQEGLDRYGLYLPQSRVIEHDLPKIQMQIKVDLKERLSSFIERIDHSFALENYKFVVNGLENEKIKDIYKKLGPFDHWENRDPDESEADAQRNLRLDFEERRSGTRYRG